MSDNGNNFYNSAIEDIANQDSTGLTSFIEATGATTQNPDTWGFYGYHYDYQGLKLLTNRMYNNIQNFIK